MANVLLIGVDSWLPDEADQTALAAVFSAPPVSVRLLSAPAAVHWTSLMTGAWPQDHRVMSDWAPGEGGAGWRPVIRADRARAALWEAGAEAGVTSVVAGWPAMQGGRGNPSGLWIADGFGLAGYLPGDFVDGDGGGVNAKLMESAVLRECWMGPDEIPGEMIGLIKPDWQKIDQERDAVLVEIGGALAESVSLNAAFLEGLETRRPRFAALRLPLMARLDAVARRRREAHGQDEFRVDSARMFVHQAIREAARRVAEGTRVVVVGLGAGMGRAEAEGWVEARIWVSGRLGESELRPGGGALAAVGRWVGSELGLELPARLVGVAGGAVRTLATRMGEMEGAGQGEAAVDPRELLKHRIEVLAVEGRFRVVVRDFRGALGVMEELVRCAPERVGFHVWKSRTEESLGLVAESLESAEIALALDPADPAVWLRALELQVSAGDLAGATARLAHRPERLGERLEWVVGFGRLLCRFRRWDEALAWIQSERRRFPGESLADLGEAIAWQGKEQWEKAEEAAKRYQQTNPRAFDGHYHVGLAQMGRGDWEGALASLELALKADPKSAKARGTWLVVKRRLGASQEELAPHEEQLRSEIEQTGRGVAEHRSEVARRRALASEADFEQDAGESGAAIRGSHGSEPLRLTLLVGVAGSRYCDFARALAAGGCPVEAPAGEGVDLGREADWWAFGENVLKRLSPALEGKVLPLAVHQFYRLPRLHSYRVLFFRCGVNEAVVRAWAADRMATLHGGGKALAMVDAAELLRRSQEQARWLMSQMPNVTSLLCDSARWVRTPDLVLRDVEKFLGEPFRFDAGASLAEGKRLAGENRVKALW